MAVTLPKSPPVRPRKPPEPPLDKEALKKKAQELLRRTHRLPVGTPSRQPEPLAPIPVGLSSEEGRRRAQAADVALAEQSRARKVAERQQRQALLTPENAGLWAEQKRAQGVNVPSHLVWPWFLREMETGEPIERQSAFGPERAAMGIPKGLAAAALQPPWVEPTGYAGYPATQGTSWRERTIESLAPKTTAEALGGMVGRLGPGMFGFGVEPLTPQELAHPLMAAAFAFPPGLVATKGLQAMRAGLGEPSVMGSLQGARRTLGGLTEAGERSLAEARAMPGGLEAGFVRWPGERFRPIKPSPEALAKISPEGRQSIEALNAERQRLFDVLSKKGRLPKEMGVRKEAEQAYGNIEARLVMNEVLAEQAVKEGDFAGAVRSLRTERDRAGRELNARRTAFHAGEKNAYPELSTTSLDVYATTLDDLIGALETPAAPGVSAQLGLGVGEKAPQAEMLGEFQGRGAKPGLIDAEEFARQQAARAEREALVAKGQIALPAPAVAPRPVAPAAPAKAAAPPAEAVAPRAAEAPIAPMSELEWAKGALSTHLLGRESQAVTTPRLSPKNLSAALRILRAAKADPEAQALLGGLKAEAEAKAKGFQIARERIIRGEAPLPAAPEAARAAEAPPAVQPAPSAPPARPAPPAPSAAEAVTPPPVKPPVAQGPPPEGPVSQKPPASPPPAPMPSGDAGRGIQEAIQAAKGAVEMSRPGLITRLLDYIPGVRQAMREVHPRLKISDPILTGWVAEGGAEATVSNSLQVERFAAAKQLEVSFGKPQVLAGETKTSLRFTGTVEQAKYPYTNTLRDVLEYPELYDLTAVERALIEDIGASRDTAFGGLRNSYNLKVGQFQRRPGGIFLSNYDVSESALEAYGSAERAGMIGRGKERFYEGARERWEHTKTFKPDTNVYRLLESMDESAAKMAGRQTFIEAVGGKTKLQAMEELHPKLATALTAVKNRVNKIKGYQSSLRQQTQDTIDDFLASGMEDADLAALQAELSQGLKPGRFVAKAQAGKQMADLRKEWVAARGELASLQTAWRVADLRPYQRVQEAGNLLFKAEDAKELSRLLKTSSNRLLRFVDNLRATVFGGDLSPVSIQGLTAWFSDPVGVSRAVAGATAKGVLPSFTEEGLVAFARANPNRIGRFTQATGIRFLGGVTPEFATGFPGKLPKVGKFWTEFNESLYRPLMRYMEAVFDASYKGALKRGLTEVQAMAVGADDASKIIPRINYRLLGQSQAEAARYRAALTSISFLTRPTALVLDATKGIVKMGLLRPLSQNEKFAARRVLTLFATIESLAVASHVAYAKSKGKDMQKAALDSLNPASGYFMSFVLPNGWKIGMGGPFRSLFRAIAPGRIEGVPVPVPFAGVPRWAMGKMGPGVRVAYDEIRDKDFYGRKIRTGDFPINILQGLAYAFEGSLPLTVGEVGRGIRIGELGADITREAIAQFAGGSLSQIPRAERLEELGPKLGLTKKGEAWQELGPRLREQIEMSPEGRAISRKYGQTVWQERREVEYTFFDQQTARDESLVAKELPSGKIYTPQAWLNDMYEAQGKLSAKLEEFDKGKRIPKPKTPNDKAMNDYYELQKKFYDEKTDTFDSEGWEEARPGFMKALAEEQRRYVEDNLHARATPLVWEYYQDREKMEVYWDIEDKQLAIFSRVIPKLEKEWEQYKLLNATAKAALAQDEPELAAALRNLDKRIRKLKETWRETHPEEEKLLFKWGFVTTLKSEKAKAKTPVSLEGLRPLREIQAGRTPVPAGTR